MCQNLCWMKILFSCVCVRTNIREIIPEITFFVLKTAWLWENRGESCKGKFSFWFFGTFSISLMNITHFTWEKTFHYSFRVNHFITRIHIYAHTCCLLLLLEDVHLFSSDYSLCILLYVYLIIIAFSIILEKSFCSQTASCQFFFFFLFPYHRPI